MTRALFKGARRLKVHMDGVKGGEKAVDVKTNVIGRPLTVHTEKEENPKESATGKGGKKTSSGATRTLFTGQLTRKEKGD